MLKTAFGFKGTEYEEVNKEEDVNELLSYPTTLSNDSSIIISNPIARDERETHLDDTDDVSVKPSSAKSSVYVRYPTYTTDSTEFHKNSFLVKYESNISNADLNVEACSSDSRLKSIIRDKAIDEMMGQKFIDHTGARLDMAKVNKSDIYVNICRPCETLEPIEEEQLLPYDYAKILDSLDIVKTCITKADVDRFILMGCCMVFEDRIKFMQVIADTFAITLDTHKIDKTTLRPELFINETIDHDFFDFTLFIHGFRLSNSKYLCICGHPFWGVVREVMPNIDILYNNKVCTTTDLTPRKLCENCIYFVMAILSYEIAPFPHYESTLATYTGFTDSDFCNGVTREMIQALQERYNSTTDIRYSLMISILLRFNSVEFLDSYNNILDAIGSQATVNKITESKKKIYDKCTYDKTPKNGYTDMDINKTYALVTQTDILVDNAFDLIGYKLIPPCLSGIYSHMNLRAHNHVGVKDIDVHSFHKVVIRSNAKLSKTDRRLAEIIHISALKRVARTGSYIGEYMILTAHTFKCKE